MLDSWPEFLIVLVKESYFYASCPLFFPPRKKSSKETWLQAVGNLACQMPSTRRTQTYLWEAAFFGANSYSSGYQRLYTAKMELSKANVSNTLNNFVNSLLTRKGTWVVTTKFPLCLSLYLLPSPLFILKYSLRVSSSVHKIPQSVNSSPALSWASVMDTQLAAGDNT